MKKDNILYSIIGVLLGFIVGFMFANSANQRGYAAQPTSAAAPQQQMEGLPPDHPPIAQKPAANSAELDAVAKLAKEKPQDFETQRKAGEVFYNAGRYDDAGKYWEAALRLRPGDAGVLVSLGNAAFDAEKLEQAEKWYALALAKRPDDVNVRTDYGLTFLLREPPGFDRAIAEFRGSLERNPTHVQTLQNLTVALTRKGDAAAALEAIARLEAVSPNNVALPQLRAAIQNAGQSD